MNARSNNEEAVVFNKMSLCKLKYFDNYLSFMRYSVRSKTLKLNMKVIPFYLLSYVRVAIYRTLIVLV